MKMFGVFAFIAVELAVLAKVFSRYSYKQLYHFFDGIWGVARLALVLEAVFLPFFLFVITVFSPGYLALLLTNLWFYLIVFIVSLVFAVIASGDSLRVFGHRLGEPVHWFDGWKGLLYLYLLVCAIMLAVVWLAWFFGEAGDFAQKKAYADNLFMANVKILLIIALAVTGRMRRHLALYDAISGVGYRVGAALGGTFEKQQSEKS